MLEEPVSGLLVFLLVAGTVWGGLVYFLIRLWREHDGNPVAS
jgi:hypothetical protein|nr:MAG: hypothetical protein KatS3mg041_0317 [Bacteroidota bacterium]